MCLKEILRNRTILGVLLLFTFIVGCDDGSSPPPVTNPPTTPPLVLSVASPFRMVEFDADTLLVTDARTNAIHFIDKGTLEPTKSVKVSGRPSGVEYHGGLIYVGNLTTGSVEVLDVDGTFQFYLGGDTGLFQKVNDIAVDQSAGLVYVLDAGAAEVRVFNADDGSDTGLVIGAGQLASPTALEIDQADGRILVSDYGPAAQVRVFNNDGTNNAAGPILGSVVGFSMPQGLYIDSSQNLFLTEARSGEVRVTDSSYSFVKAIGVRGTGEDELYYPLDVFVDSSSSNIFVTDNNNHRIVVYLGGGTVP